MPDNTWKNSNCPSGKSIRQAPAVPLQILGLTAQQTLRAQREQCAFALRIVETETLHGVD